jgi:hypothetical protein
MNPIAAVMPVNRFKQGTQRRWRKRGRIDQGGGVAAIGTAGFLRSPSILRWK